MTPSDIVFIHEVEQTKVHLWRVRMTLCRSEYLTPQVKVILDDALKLAYDVLTDGVNKTEHL